LLNPFKKNVLKKGIAFFDFDGTITKSDTLLEIIKFQKGMLKFYFGFILYCPLLIAFKMGLVSNSTAKQRIFRHFFKGDTIAGFQLRCDQFAEKVLPSLLRYKALAEIDKLKAMEIEVVIVSASAENWIKKWSDSINAALIATRLEIANQLVTGNIAGNNCYGPEKVERIRAIYDLSVYQKVYCYGDTNGDLAMLALGDICFYKPFR
jgi:phosphatidylglycerophosphatase C